MPEMPCIAQAHRLPVFLDVRHDQHLRMTGELELPEHVDLERAEAATERHLLFGRDALIPEHQYVVLQVSAMQPREIAVAEWARQVQPEHLGTQRRVERADL
jgi:hypothetical protein